MCVCVCLFVGASILYTINELFILKETQDIVSVSQGNQFSSPFPQKSPSVCFFTTLTCTIAPLKKEKEIIKGTVHN